MNVFLRRAAGVRANALERREARGIPRLPQIPFYYRCSRRPLESAAPLKRLSAFSLRYVDAGKRRVPPLSALHRR